VVDDVPTNLDVAKGLMKPYSLTIDTALSGQKAIELIRDEEVKYDAIFMDHMMPEMDGIEATEKIRELGTDYAKNIPVIALTANAIIGSEKMFLSKGFQAYLTKPIDTTRLDTILTQWLRDKAKEKEWFEQHKDEIVVKEKEADEEKKRGGTESRILGFGVNGLNIEKGLERFGGDEEVYFDILQSFVNNTPPLLVSIKDISPENLETYAIVAHGIKGSSRGICADKFAFVAEKLEKAAKAGDFEFVSAHNESFLEAAWKLIEDIKRMIRHLYPREPKPLRGEPDAEILALLLKACVGFDMDTVDGAIAELEKYEYETGGELVLWLRENIDVLNFSEIVKRLSSEGIT
jgi:CheY-like chemotaxis protein/HPt (histidine-containing phosphotransfer) domain-containing protein